MEEKIVLDQQSFKALAADSRVKILKILGKRRHTQSELAADLNLSIPTVKEHLKALEKAELVSMKDEGRKWKYYELSRKGRGILDPEMKKIWILLSVIGLMVFAGLSGVMKQAFSPMYGMGLAETQSFDSINSAKIAKDSASALGTDDAISSRDSGSGSGIMSVPDTAESSAPVAAMNGGGDEADLNLNKNELVEPEASVDEDTTKGALIDDAVIEEYKLSRPDFSGLSFNSGVKIYLGILGVLIGFLLYFVAVRYKRMH